MSSTVLALFSDAVLKPAVRELHRKIRNGDPLTEFEAELVGALLTQGLWSLTGGVTFTVRAAA